MAPTETNSQEPAGESTNTRSSSSQSQVTENGKESTETTQKANTKDGGCEKENDVGKDSEEKHLEKEKKGTEDVLKEIQMPKTHDLYCPNCTHKITGTAKLFKKGEEVFPYNIENFILRFVVVISFKYPFIYLPWLYNPEQVEPDQPNTPPPQGIYRTLATLLVKMREKLLPNRLPRPSPTSQLLVLVLLLLSVILLWTLPSRPSPPPPPIRPGEIVTESEVEGDNGGGFSSSWLINFLSNNYLSVFSLLSLAILAVLWHSMIEGPENGPQKTGGTTIPQKPGHITDQDEDGIEVIPEEKPKIENEKQHPPNKEASDSSIKLDIIKSIVYGGLIESITSFGVVSSAAASGTSTLNVLTLGLANLSSGLFIIIHNLYGLFTGPRYPSWNNDHMAELVAVDPYKELLGKRTRVILHCFVVLISFIFFGVIPPLFYGFSYKITDKGHYEEAAVVVAASLVCVISLSFAKAYAFSMNKLKTVAAYSGIAIVGSVVSFIASQHASDVFAKYDFHKLASDYLKG